MELGLRDKVVIVTGGSSGIGLAAVRQFLEEGACVATLARGEERLRAATAGLPDQGRLFAEACDVGDGDAVTRYVERVVERFGGVDCLVNNAGGGRTTTFATTSDDAWRAELELKFFSLIYPVRAVLPYMQRRGGGRIVNVNAILARQPEPHMVATSAARAGVLNLSRSLANELAQDNILVNTVSLGLIESDQWHRRHQERAAHLSREQYLQQVAADRRVPMQRFGTPEEVAGVMVFLCSNRASYVTGAVIDIGGGVHHYV